MPTPLELESFRRSLRATFPLVGRYRRRSAIAKLEDLRDDPEVIELLIESLGLADKTVVARAEAALAQAAPGPARNALCERAIKDPSGLAARIARDGAMRHSDHERNCLYLWVTNQLDPYFIEDFQFQALRMEFDRADAVVRNHVMAIVRTGHIKCTGLLDALRKGWHQWSEKELTLALESWKRHEQWKELFAACLELPLKYSLGAFAALGASGWKPGAPDEASLLASVLADLPAHQTAASATGNGGVFERWLSEGATGKLAALGEADLEKRLESASPPEAVKLVAALATKAGPGSRASMAVRNSSHWLVRLAGLATGLVPMEPGKPVDDPNYWVRDLAGAASVLEVWPGQTTPADLEAMSRLPSEAWVGRLGAARRLLRTVIADRMDVPEPVQIVFEADGVTPEPVPRDGSGT